MGSLAQMWKALFKALGLPMLRAVTPFLNKIVSEKDAHAKLSTDVYLGQQCMAAEILGGLVRGIKYWPPDGQDEAKKQVCLVLDFVVGIPEMESAGVWASMLRFGIFDRHPTRISWLMQFLFDDYPPYHKDTNSTLLCRRIALLKPIINELSWRGSPLHRQLLHDVEPYLASPFTQTREFASSCVALISRVTWGPAWAEQAETSEKYQSQAEQGGTVHVETVDAKSGHETVHTKSLLGGLQLPASRRPSSHWGITPTSGALSPSTKANIHKHTHSSGTGITLLDSHTYHVCLFP